MVVGEEILRALSMERGAACCRDRRAGAGREFAEVAMEYRVLGSSSLQVSAVGFGCWQAGGYYWGHVDERDWIAAVHRALDPGMTFFDTADFCGFGRSEELLAKALGSRRREVVIATKVGLVSRGGRRDFGATDLPELERHVEKDLSRSCLGSSGSPRQRASLWASSRSRG